MKTPLNYQLSEYDCGPTSLLNGMSYLFEREEIPPEIIKTISGSCLDCPGADGSCGKRGTSCEALMNLSRWLSWYGDQQHTELQVSSDFLRGDDVNFHQGSKLIIFLQKGGVAVLHLYLDHAGHYVLVTGESDRDVYIFDPYYCSKPFSDDRIKITTEHPLAFNRIIPKELLSDLGYEDYSMGPVHTREALFLFNKNKSSSN